MVPEPDHEQRHGLDRVTFLQEAGQIIATQNLSWLVFGIGYDNFRHFRMFDPASYERVAEGFIESESYPTHNTHLTVFLEMGMIAFLCWALMHVLMIRRLYRAWRRRGPGSGEVKRTRGLIAAIAGALLLAEIAFLIGGNGHTLIPAHTVMSLFWLTLGVAAHPSGPFADPVP